MSNNQDNQARSYAILETLSVSPRSVVRRARRSSDGACVVLKSFNQSESGPEQREELQRELDKLQQLASPMIVQGLEIAEVEGRAVLVLEDFAGQVMSIPESGLDISVCLQRATQIARALGKVHEQGLIHNDLKPENLLISQETGQLKLIDFRVASAKGALGNTTATLDSSLPYMSPERTGRVNRRPDHRADYYSFGITLFQMLTGSLPFTANDALGWAHAHLSKQAPLASQIRPSVPRMLAEFVGKLMAKNPDQRYQSSHGLLADLTTFSEQFAQTGELSDFPLGKRDICQEFQISHEPVGRERELALVLGELEQVKAGATRIALLSGVAGVGKSALLSEFARQVNEQRLILLSSTFDRQALNVPFSGLVQALQGLISELLSRSEEGLAERRRQILSALGANASVLSDLLPDLARVLGTQPAVAVLDPIETQHRLQHVLCAFLGVFARPEQPVVVVLEDCQWMDGATADALSAILTSPELHHLMVLASFRDAEVSEGHPLLRLRETVQREAPRSLLVLRLEPLDAAAVERVCANTLRATESEISEFARLVHGKTAGNPFFVGELLSSMYRQGILTLNMERGFWQIDLDGAKACEVSDNVGTLMADQLDRIAPATAELLASAACFGTRFELAALAEVVDIEPSACSALLWEAASERLVVPLTEGVPAKEPNSDIPPAWSSPGYVFQHARVQQAAATRLSKSQRILLHGRIGRWLQRKALGDDARTRIFDVLQHLNRARATLTEPSERMELCELNLQASALAVQAAASDIAEAHALVAVELLGNSEPALAPELAFRAHFARAEAVFQVGNSVQAESLCDVLGELAPDKIARARVHVLKTRILEHQGRLFDAVAEIRVGVGELGLLLPETPELINRAIGDGIAKMQAHLARVSVEELADLPEVASAETRMVLSLLQQLIPPAIQTYPPLFILAELIMFDLALTHGVSVASCKNFVDCGIIQAGILSNHDVAYRLGQAAFELLKRYSPTPMESGVSFVFAAFVSHWRVPYQEGFAAYDRAEKMGLELGDLQHVAYALAHRTQRSFLTGKRLLDCQSEVNRARAYLTRINARGQLVGALVAERASARLVASRSEAEAVERADAEAKAAVVASRNNQWAYSYGQAQVMTHYILADFERANAWQAFTKPYSSSAASLFSVADYHLFEALLLVRACRETAPEGRAECLKTIDQHLQKLAIWAKACPENFAHKFHLLSAERSRLEAEPVQVALAHYGHALDAAGDGFPQMRGLIHELEAALWHSLDDARHARASIEAAYRAYQSWGATAKLQLLERAHPAWLADRGRGGEAQTDIGAGPISTHRRGGLDAASILKATQSISREVQPQRLFSALMSTLIESAGAQQGSLILRDEDADQFYVEARADVERLAASPAERAPLDGAESICPSIVRYVLRSRETVTLDDACARGPYQADPYIKREGVRSLLCAPILRQGEILGVLYLENNLTSHAFTQERLDILQVIASQAAISIYNAQLYESLERRVAQRTAELAQKNREIASMLDNLDQGVFTIDETLTVQPGYSRYLAQILGTSEILGKGCIELLFGGANARPDSVSAAASALSFSFGVEPWLAEANASHLIGELEKIEANGQSRYLEISWNLICNDAGLVERVLVSVRDVTLMRALKQAASEKQREVDIIAQALEAGLGELGEFCAVCRERLAESRSAIAASARPSADTVAAMFRHFHTLKGNARMHGFTLLVDGLHEAESAFDALRREPEQLPDTVQLLAELDGLEKLVAQYEDVCQRKLAPLAKNHDTRSERALEEIAALIADADARGDESELLQRVRTSLARLDPSSLSYLVEEASRPLRSLAAELGKATPMLLYSGEDVRLLVEWRSLIRDVLVQCFRNSVYHGIESPEERRLAGKNPQGQIEVRALRGPANALELQISDDGRGLALDILRRLSGCSGLSDDVLSAIIFEPGTSTNREVDHVAGRGVGLDIVRSRLRERGGDAFVRFSAKEGAGYRPFALVLRLPLDARTPATIQRRPSFSPQAAE